MSDGAQILAFKLEDREATATATAARVTAWLVERGIIEATPTDSGLGGLAHRPGPEVASVVVAQRAGVVDFRSLRTNGLEFTHGARPFLVMAGDEIPGFACPACQYDLETDDVFPLIEHVPKPFAPAPAPTIACPGCGNRPAVHALIVSEGGAFANVVLRFWNWWPLTPRFVEELGVVTDVEPKMLYERV